MAKERHSVCFTSDTDKEKDTLHMVIPFLSLASAVAFLLQAALHFKSMNI